MIVQLIPGRRLEKRLRVAAYCRVSTDKAMQADSLETQKHAYQQLIASTPQWRFAGLYADEGTGTQTGSRPAFQQMMRDALQGKIDVILVKSISRFARNAVDCQRCVQQLAACGVAVRFEREHLDSMDPSSEMILSLLSVIAQDESRSISDNVKWGYRQRQAQGIYRLGNNRMLGYDMRTDGVLVPNQDAWMVRLAFVQFVQGSSYRAIASEINRRGGHCLRSDKPLTPTHIRAMLANEVYVGDRRLQKKPPLNFLTKRPDPRQDYQSYYLRNIHAGIVDRAMWNEAQLLLEKRQQEKDSGVLRKRENSHALYGVVYCGCCGAPYIRRTMREYARPGAAAATYKAWVCKERLKGKRGNGCKGRIIREAQLLAEIAQRSQTPAQRVEILSESIAIIT